MGADGNHDNGNLVNEKAMAGFINLIPRNFRITHYHEDKTITPQEVLLYHRIIELGGKKYNI